MKKRAVILTSECKEKLTPLIHISPLALFHLINRPLIVYIIENLINQGFKTFDIFLYYRPEMIRKELGDGSRWGIQIAYHLIKDPIKPFKDILNISKSWSNEHILLGVDYSLPKFSFEEITPFSKENSVIFINDHKNRWLKWAYLSATSLQNISQDIAFDHLPSAFEKESIKTLQTRSYLFIQSLLDLEKNNEQALTDINFYPFFPSTARMVKKGIWLSRASSIHPKAKLIPPVFIGEGTQLQKGAKIGPFAVIEDNCFVSENTKIKHSLIYRKTFIGEGLDINNSLIAGNKFINLNLNTYVEIQDAFILSEFSPPSLKNYLTKSIGSWAATFLLILLAPIFIPMYLIYPIKKESKLKIPASLNPDHWKTFNLLSFTKKNKKEGKIFKKLKHLPKLLNLIREEVHFAGLKPRSIEEVNRLPTEWKQVYLHSKAGLITLDKVTSPKKKTEKQIYESEIYYAAHQGFFYDLSLLFRWITKKLFSY